MTDDLVSRLNAELTRREAIAKAATSSPWQEVIGNTEEDWMVLSIDHNGQSDDVTGSGLPEADAAHIAENDPAFVLRWVSGVREILERHRATNNDKFCAWCGTGVWFPCPDVSSVASMLGVEP